MSISFNHPKDTMTSTSTLDLIVLGGTPSSPKPIRLNASSIIVPVRGLPVGEIGSMVLDSVTKTMKYHDGTKWIELLDSDTVLEPIEVSLNDIYRKLDTKVDSVTYSSSTVPSATISGTTLNVVFPIPSSSGAGPTGLYTATKPGCIMQYSLSSGMNAAKIREQMAGVANGQAGRNGSQGAPYKTSDGWCFADGMWWQWAGENGTITKQVPNLCRQAYMRSIDVNGTTKTDAVIAGGGTIGNTALSVAQLPPLQFSVSGSTSSAGNHVHNQPLRGSDRSGHNAITSSRDDGVPTIIQTAAAGAHIHTFSGVTNVLGSGWTHTHTLTNVDVPHYNVAFLYNIAEGNVALSEKVANTKYVLKSGDVMAGPLTVATSASIKGGDASLSLYFRNASNAERAVIYHNSSSNTLRLRSGTSSSTEVTISTDGTLTASKLVGTSLSISGSSAVINSKNIALSVNGNTADATGNITLTSGVVQDVRLSARVESGSLITNGWNYAPNGSLLDGLWKSSGGTIDKFTHRVVQKKINGVWIMVEVEA